MSKKTIAGIEVEDTSSIDVPAPQVVSSEVVPSIEEKPSEGGSYTRQPDESLTRNTSTGGRNG